MRNISMEKNIGKELPQEKLVPDPNRNKSEVEVDAAADQHLEKEGGSHDDHQLLKHRRETITKRETVLLVSHVNPVKNKVLDYSLLPPVWIKRIFRRIFLIWNLKF